MTIEVPTELVEYIVEAASRGFNPHYDKIGALARDLLKARKLLSHPRMRIITDDDAGIETDADFGCVQWEAK